MAKTAIGTSTSGNGWATNYSFQRKIFLAAGLIWVFYSDGGVTTGLKFRTSGNGVNWSAATQLVVGSTETNFGHRISLWSDGIYIHYAYCPAADGGDVFYRRGLLNSDGTVTWSAVQQTVVNIPAGKNVYYPTIFVEPGGYPWIGYMLFDGGFNTLPSDAICVKCANNDGTWATAAGFPYVLYNNNPTSYSVPVGVPLTGGKVFWVYNKEVAGGHYYGNLWTGAAWNGEEECSTNALASSNFNLVTEGDDVHFCFLIPGAPYDILYRKRTYGVGWGAETTIVANAAAQHIGLSFIGPNSVVIFYQDSPTANHVYYRKMINGAWSAAVDWINEAVDTISNVLSLNSLVASPAGRFDIGLAYVTKAASPYNVNFAWETVVGGKGSSLATKVQASGFI